MFKMNVQSRHGAIHRTLNDETWQILAHTHLLCDGSSHSKLDVGRWTLDVRCS
jgi:hypothetical protein